MTYTDLMVDLETLGTAYNAPIVSLAAVAFNATENAFAYIEDNYTIDQQLGQTVKALVSKRGYAIPKYARGISIGIAYDPQSEIESKPKRETMDWWISQPEAVRTEALGGNVKMVDSLGYLQMFIDEHTVGRDKVRVWAKGPSFDITMLDYQYDQRLGMTPPWKFYNVRCVRTITAAAGGIRPVSKEFTAPSKPHVAILDALAQAREVALAHQILGL